MTGGTGFIDDFPFAMALVTGMNLLNGTKWRLLPDINLTRATALITGF